MSMALSFPIFYLVGKRAILSSISECRIYDARPADKRVGRRVGREGMRMNRRKKGRKSKGEEERTRDSAGFRLF